MKQMSMTISSVVALTVLPSVSGAQPHESSLAKAICGTDADCHLRSVDDAGKDEAGRQMWVVNVGRAGPKANYDAVGWHTDCNTHQYWLVTAPRQRPAPKRNAKGASKQALDEPRLLVEICNDGYGSRGIGEDHVTVKPNRFTYSRSGGSAWGWWQTWVVQLSPTRIVRESSSGYYTLSQQNSEGKDWDWESLKGTASWSAPACLANGSPPSDGGTERSFAYTTVPEVVLPRSFRNGGWKTIPFDECAARVDASGATGHVVHGKAGDAKDAAMSVVAASPTEFYVSVIDDERRIDAKNWLHRDHLEVWVGTESSSYFDHCLEKRNPAMQWAVLGSGEVKKAHGKHDRTLRAQVQAAGDPGQDRVTYKLTFSKPVDWVSFVYSDSDDGASQERLIATSDLSFGDGASLGGLRNVPKEEGTCRLRNGELRWDRSAPDPTKPVIDD